MGDAMTKRQAVQGRMIQLVRLNRKSLGESDLFKFSHWLHLKAGDAQPYAVDEVVRWLVNLDQPGKTAIEALASEAYTSMLGGGGVSGEEWLAASYVSVLQESKRVRKLLFEIRELIAHLPVDPLDDELRPFGTEDEIHRSLERALVIATRALQALEQELAEQSCSAAPTDDLWTATAGSLGAWALYPPLPACLPNQLVSFEQTLMGLEMGSHLAVANVLRGSVR